jgi:CTP synthase
MVEIGGTVGDIESLPFLEAIRQLGVELGRNNVLYMHLTLIPYIATLGRDQDEADAALRQGAASIGIQPTCCCAAVADPLPAEQRRKIALFTNVEERAVILGGRRRRHLQDSDAAARAGLDAIVVDKLALDAPPADLREWQHVVAAKSNPDHGHGRDGRQVREPARLLHLALRGADARRAPHAHARQARFIEAHGLEKHGTGCLDGVDAILVPGGFGERGIDGKIQAVRFAREHGIPYLGICLGMQLAIIEYARNVAGLAGAHAPSSTGARRIPSSR